MSTLKQFAKKTRQKLQTYFLKREWMHEFLQHLEFEKRYSAHTIAAYKNDLKQFYKTLASPEIDRRVFNNFAASLRNYKTTTAARRLWALKSFLLFLYTKEYIDKNLSPFVDLPKKEEPLPSFLTADEVQLLLNQPNIKTFNGLRDRLILELLYYTGMRVSELCGIRYCDIEDTYVKVFGKNKRERLLPLGVNCRHFLKEYLKFNQSPKNPSNPVFTSKHGKPITRIGVYRLIVKYAKKSCIEKKVFPHMIRHTCATHLLDNGADLRAIQSILGHTNIASTVRYTHVSARQMAKCLEKYHPQNIKDE